MKLSLKNALNRILVCATLMSINSTLLAGGVVIVHPQNQSTLTEKQIAQIYSGKRRAFTNKSKAIPIERPNSQLREAFLKSVLKTKDKSLQRLWAKLTFTGQGKMPERIESDAEVIERVASDPNSIGYIDAMSVDETVRVLIKF